MRRFFSLIYLSAAALLLLLAFADYVDVRDTGSLHWGAGLWDNIALAASGAGLMMLLLGVGFRMFAARWMLSGALAICIGMIVRSLLSYPREAGDLAYSFVPSRSVQELYGLLILGVALLIVTLFADTVRRVVGMIAGSRESHDRG